jgi:hypothetical protein
MEYNVQLIDKSCSVEKVKEIEIPHQHPALKYSKKDLTKTVV